MRARRVQASPLPARDTFAARADLRTCIGPQAFAKGGLKFLSAGVVRWLVASERFASDTRYAEELVGGAPPASKQAGAATDEQTAAREA